MIKKLGKAILCLKLESRVERLRANNGFMVVAVGAETTRGFADEERRQEYASIFLLSTAGRSTP